VAETKTCVLVGVVLKNLDYKKVLNYIEELKFLALTANLETKQIFIQRLNAINPDTFIGKGKLNEIADFVYKNKIDYVIFDDELSGSQIRNIEKIVNTRVIDRTNLILDIFAMRAKTAYAKIQVELAQYEYLLPRLVHLWTHLERQRGGIGLRGPGEKELETDRRLIKKRISILKNYLKKIDRQMLTQRKQRNKLVRVSLIGYTNVGKSTIMNLITKANVLAENKLFATLDTTVRRVCLDNITFLLSDTIGFIRKLPHLLIESFKSTLDEVRESDVLIHVIDISSENYEEQIKVVENTLRELGVKDKTFLYVYNKFDKFIEQKINEYTSEEIEFIEKKLNSSPNTVVISAIKEINTKLFLEKLLNLVKEVYDKKFLKYEGNSFRC